VTGPVALARPLPREVVGERLRLALWSDAEVEEIRQIVERSRPELSEFLGWAIEPLSHEDEARIQRESEERWRAGQMAAWAIHEGTQLCGMLGLHRRGGPDELEIGYWLDSMATGRGLMTMACTLATDVAFTYDGVELVEIVHDARNLRSQGVPMRLGFQRVAAFTGTPVAPSESGIKVRWIVRKRDWLATHPVSSVLAVKD
jgi:RimJ/RimL family protein N-acetyltransferase